MSKSGASEKKMTHLEDSAGMLGDNDIWGHAQGFRGSHLCGLSMGQHYGRAMNAMR